MPSAVPPLPSRFLVLALLAVCAMLQGGRCGSSPRIQINTPLHGSFSTSADVSVTGQVLGIGTNQIADVLVNGSSVPLGQGNSFSASVPLDSAAVFNPIVVEVIRTGGAPKLRSRVTVLAGESIADGDLSPMGVGLRLNDSGLDDVEPVIASLVDFDLATLLPVGTVLIDDECFITVIGCWGSATVSIQSPPPSLSGFGIAIDSMTNLVDGDIDVNDLQVDVFIDGSGLVPNCGLRLTASTLNLFGSYGLQPGAVDPTTVDVNQSGSISPSFNGFNQQFTSGLCDDPIIGDIIGLIIGDVEPIVVDGLRDFLDDPDGSGPADSPIADAIEVALEDIEISGPIGEAIGVTLETPLFDVFEDVDGITLDADARVTASMPDPQAVDLAASYHVPEAFPPFGPTTPAGGLPYDLALAISTSAFNQLMKAEVESGLLIASLTELSLFGGQPQPITAGLLAQLVPEFGLIDPPSTPIRIDIAPTLAPVITGEAGPQGELAELRIGHLNAQVVVDQAPQQVLLELAVDARVGLDVALAGGELSFLLGSLQPEDIDITILRNTLASDEILLDALLQQLLPLLLPSLADSLGTFPLPDFVGLSLAPVEIGKSGEFLSLFLDLQ